jgi:hypothetical protein
MDLDLGNWMVAYVPNLRDPKQNWTKKNGAPPGAIEVGPWPVPDAYGPHDWTLPYRMTDGMCSRRWREADHMTQAFAMFVCFHTAVVRDGIDPQDAHREFLKISEYRRRISPDIEGANDE